MWHVLFNSFIFLFVFLPIVGVGMWAFIRMKNPSYGVAWLIFASCVFYAHWNASHLILLAGSIGTNYLISILIVRQNKKVVWLAIGILFNILLLGYYKYLGFLSGILRFNNSNNLPILQVALPLGISFFTFQQIAYLVDIHKKKFTVPSLSDYFLFISFFPQLIAGPIVHAKEFIPQLKKSFRERITIDSISTGCMLFAMGLCKKTILADSLNTTVSIIFTQAEHGATISLYQAWSASLGYTLQLYFDFSGYSDMAIGLAALFGFHLPINFFSPYKSKNIRDFWQRWHITLSNWLREYVYIPLGGNRKGKTRQMLNLFITMLIGGLWHGAGWMFILWGAIHGIYLCINHLWIKIDFKPKKTLFIKGMNIFAHVITLLAIIIGWVIFRSPDINTAIIILKAMTHIHELSFTTIAYESRQWILEGFALNSTPIWFLRSAWISILFCIILITPNSNEIVKGIKEIINNNTNNQQIVPRKYISILTGVSFGIITIASIFCIATFHEQVFLYFQF